MVNVQFEQVLAPWMIKDVVIIQRGNLLWEWHERGTDRIGPIYSCTKSILSALIGIALEQGHLPSLDEPLSNFFDGQPKANVTVRHLLTMTPGWEWPDFDKPYNEMKKSEDCCQFVLKQPIIHEPGEAFTYNSGGSHLLSAILTKVTGKSALELAVQQLFKPMKFRTYKWTEFAGSSEGGTGLQLTSRDMAKFGKLFLQKGEWDGERLVPESWVSLSTSAHHKAQTNYEPPIYGAYGFHWWNSNAEHNGVVELYFALGFGGQYIFVIPEVDAVVVIRRKVTKKNEAILSKRLLFEYIWPWLQKEA